MGGVGSVVGGSVAGVVVVGGSVGGVVVVGGSVSVVVVVGGSVVVVVVGGGGGRNGNVVVVVAGTGGWCFGFTVEVVVVGCGALVDVDPPDLPVVPVVVPPDLAGVVPVVLGGMNGNATENGAVWMLGGVVAAGAFLTFLVGFFGDAVVVGAGTVVAVVVGGGGTRTGSCGGVVVVVVSWVCFVLLFTESPTRACPTARGA
jgi:hypothetical protein